MKFYEIFGNSSEHGTELDTNCYGWTVGYWKDKETAKDKWKILCEYAKELERLADQ